MEKSNELKLSKFLIAAGVCSLLGALTTGLLLFLPAVEALDFDSRVQLYQNNLYLTKLWILFFHPQFNTIASFGICVLLFRKYPLQIIPGTLFILVWFFSEMAQQAFLIDALNQMWRPGYVEATDEINQDINRTLIHGATGLSDSKYFLVLYGFGLGSLLYGLAFIQEQKVAKWIGLALIFIGILSLFSFLRYYLGMNFLSPYVDWTYSWIYPYLQPLVRIGIAFWIFSRIKKI
jgi:hypothetical protein